jgi:hypothetical protein
MPKPLTTESKYLTPELKAAAEGLAEVEIVDEREEKLKAIWPAVRDALAKGMSHRQLYDRLKSVIGGPNMKFSSFTKLVGKLAARGKKKKADLAVKPEAKPAKPKPAAKPNQAAAPAPTATPVQAAE